MLSASKPKCSFGHWSKMTLKLSSYLLPKFSRVPFSIVLISRISTMVNSTQLNFGIEILRWLRGQWPKLHLGLNALSNQKILKGIYYVLCTYLGLVFGKNDFETTSLSRKLVYYLGKTKIFTHFGKPDFKATNCRLYLLGVVPSGLCINCLIKVCKLLFFWKFCFSTKGQIPWDKVEKI